MIQYNHYVHRMYMVLGIISHLWAVQRIQECVCRFCANTTPACMKNLSTHGLRHLWGVSWKQPPRINTKTTVWIMYIFSYDIYIRIPRETVNTKGIECVCECDIFIFWLMWWWGLAGSKYLGQDRDPGKSWPYSSSQKAVCWQNSLFGEDSSFFLKATSWLDEAYTHYEELSALF